MRSFKCNNGLKMRNILLCVGIVYFLIGCNEKPKDTVKFIEFIDANYLAQDVIKLEKSIGSERVFLDCSNRFEIFSNRPVETDSIAMIKYCESNKQQVLIFKRNINEDLNFAEHILYYFDSAGKPIGNTHFFLNPNKNLFASKKQPETLSNYFNTLIQIQKEITSKISSKHPSLKKETNDNFRYGDPCLGSHKSNGYWTHQGIHSKISEHNELVTDFLTKSDYWSNNQILITLQPATSLVPNKYCLPKSFFGENSRYNIKPEDLGLKVDVFYVNY